MVLGGLFEADYAPKVNIRLAQFNYLPGQQVTGQVSLKLSKSYRFSEIVVDFIGFREAAVTKKVGKHSKRYHERINYFNVSMCLFKDKSGEKLAVGEHIFPFNFLLPTNLPDSFGASKYMAFGGVRYWVELTISNPSILRATLKKELDILVFTPHCGPQVPVSLSENVPISSWFCLGSGGTVSWTLTFDKRAWVAGEVIDLAVFVDNKQSSYETRGAYAQLTRHVVFTPQSVKTTCSSRECTAETTQTVPAKETRLLTMQLHLPADLQSSCRLDLFSCTYILEVYLDIPFNIDPVIKVPVAVYRLRAEETAVTKAPATTGALLGYEPPVYSTSPTDSPPAYA